MLFVTILIVIYGVDSVVYFDIPFNILYLQIKEVSYPVCVRFNCKYCAFLQIRIAYSIFESLQLQQIINAECKAHNILF
jgi:hypothetical protein